MEYASPLTGRIARIARAVASTSLATLALTEPRRIRRVREEVDDLHEHLGQLIAYARMNDIVPPWSK
jgi:hypothetical protein